MLKRNVAIVLVAALVLGGSALALAQGGPPRPTAEPGGKQGGADRQARRWALRQCLDRAGQDEEARRRCQAEHGKVGPGVLRRAVHGDLIVRGEDGSFQTVAFDRGMVNQATDGARIVLDRPDGKQATLQLTADTRYRGVGDAGALRKGQPAMVVSRDGKAVVVAQRSGDHGPR